MTKAHVVPVIEVTVTHGKGTNEEPFRIFMEYWSLDGTFLAERNVEMDTNDIIQKRKYQVPLK